MSAVIADASNSNPHLTAALAYVALGWSVVPLHFMVGDRCSCGNEHDGEARVTADGKEIPGMGPGSRGKHPHTMFARNGVHGASKDASVITRWFSAEPHLNIGIACGATSGFIAVDIDPRAGGDATMDQFMDRQRAKMPDTVVADTGGGGTHYLFAYADGVTIRSPGKGVDIKSDGGYIIVEPSTHASGKRYVWQAECDPLEGATLAPIPAWLASPVAAPVLNFSKGGGGSIDPQRVNDIRAALQHVDHDDYQSWIQVGMALHSTDAPEAFDLWDEFSKRSSKYEIVALRQKWDSFGRSPRRVNVESIFVWARDRGWNGDAVQVATSILDVKLLMPRKAANGAKAAESDRADPASLGLLSIPGALGELVQYMNETAPKPQPMLAVGAALALGSIALARRFVRTERNNLSGLYFINIAKSASGKEYPARVIERCLDEAEWTDVMGRSGYTSDSAVFSALYHQPAHLTIIDEIGSLLGNNASEGAHYSRAAITSLTEVWGRLEGTMKPKAYATMGLNTQQQDAMLKRVVKHPSITVLGMTTPGTWYNALSHSSIENGFLSRLICIESDVGRAPMGDAVRLPIPERVLKWLHDCRYALAARAGGNLAGTDAGPELTPQLVDVPTDAAASRAFRAYDVETIASMNRLEVEGLAELEGRSVEKAMRIALILAVSISPSSPRVSVECAEWAIAFVRYWTAVTIAAVKANMHGTKFGELQAAVGACIDKSMPRGRTERELAQFCHGFRGIDLRARRAVLDALASTGGYKLVESASESGRGRKRKAWVAVVPESEE